MSERPMLEGVSWTLDAEVCELADNSFSDVRAGHGVLALFDASGVCVRVVASSDGRVWLRDRLGGPAAGPASGSGLDERGRPEVDLRPVVSRVSVSACGSMLEADLIWASAARSLTPDAAADAADRARVWCVVASRRDGGRSDGALRLISRAWPMDVAEGARADKVTGASGAVGPFGSKSAAERFAAAAGLVSGVSLSPSLLTEPGEIEAHERAVVAGLAIGESDLRRSYDEVVAGMRRAAAEQAYEVAASMKQTGDVLESVLDEPGGWSVGPLDREGTCFRWLGLMPGTQPKRVRPLVVTPFGWVGLPERAVEELEPTLVFEADAASAAMNDVGQPDVLVMDALVRAMRRGREGWFRLGAGEVVRGMELKEAAERAAERSRG